MHTRKVFCDKIHGVLDYGVAVMFLAAPSQAGITGISATLCYALAAIQFVMTLLTDMPLGARKIIPMRVHGMVELAASLALVSIGWVFPTLFASGQLFFTLMGAVIFFVWVSSDYREHQVAVRV